jgi:hypothetical protein
MDRMASDEPSPAARERLARAREERRRRAQERRQRRRAEIGIHAILLALGVVVTVFFLTSRSAGGDWAWTQLPLDDDWIHLAYADNLVEHGGFHYNPGEPEAGMSSPLWVVMLAGVLATGIGPVAAAKGLSIALGLAVPSLTYRLARELGVGKVPAVAVGAYAAIDPNLAFARVSGMEVALTAVLLLLGLVAALRRRYLALGLCCGLMIVTRPELSVAIVLLAGAVFFEHYLGRDEAAAPGIDRQDASVAARLLVPVLLLGSLWALHNYTVNGTALPNTYFVKHDYGLGLLEPENLVAIFRGYFQHTALLGGVWAIAVVGLGVYAVTRQFRWTRVPELAVTLVPWALVLAVSTSVRLRPAYWNFGQRRYLDFLLPVLVVMAVYGFTLLLRAIERLWGRRGVRTAWSVAMLLAVLVGVRAGIRLPEMASEYSWSCENIARANVEIGTWIAENTPSDALVAVSDAGAQAYYDERYTIDLLGLNTHEAIGRPIAELLPDFRPDYAILYSYPEIEALPYLVRVRSYVPERNVILGGNEIVVYRVDREELPTLEEYYESLE